RLGYLLARLLALEPYRGHSDPLHHPVRALRLGNEGGLGPLWTGARGYVRDRRGDVVEPRGPKEGSGENERNEGPFRCDRRLTRPRVAEQCAHVVDEQLWLLKCRATGPHPSKAGGQVRVRGAPFPEEFADFAPKTKVWEAIRPSDDVARASRRYPGHGTRRIAPLPREAT